MAKKGHKTGCVCCDEGLEAVEAWEKAAMKKHGWFAHFVFDDPTYPFEVNCHTHGLPKKYKGHPDLQICLPLPTQTAHSILWEVVDILEKGGSFKAGDVSFDIIKDYPVTFIDAVENERKVLRIIFPDPSGCIKKEEMDDLYKKQWKIVSQN